MTREAPGSGAAPAIQRRAVYVPGSTPPGAVRSGRFLAFRAIGDEGPDALVFIDHKFKGSRLNVSRMGIHVSEFANLRRLLNRIEKSVKP